MGNRNNVIDLNARRAAKDEKQTRTASSAATVLDMTERRQAALQEERRTVRRTILTEFIGAFVVIPNFGLKKVALYDISENGLAFDLDFELGQLKHGEEIAMRVYLSQFTYFPFTVKISNIREIPEEGVTRHGAVFEKETVNEEALYHFIKFIECVSVDLHRDSGDFHRRTQK